MEIKLNRKFIKLCVAALALITTTGTLFPNITMNLNPVTATPMTKRKVFSSVTK